MGWKGCVWLCEWLGLRVYCAGVMWCCVAVVGLLLAMLSLFWLAFTFVWDFLGWRCSRDCQGRVSLPVGVLLIWSLEDVLLSLIYFVLAYGWEGAGKGGGRWGGVVPCPGSTQLGHCPTENSLCPSYVPMTNPSIHLRSLPPLTPFRWPPCRDFRVLFPTAPITS
jgi:hypothetical protein